MIGLPVILFADRKVAMPLLTMEMKTLENKISSN
jgi:hypothetical protein